MTESGASRGSQHDSSLKAMDGILSRISRELGIRSIHSFEELSLVPEDYKEEKILGLLRRYCRDYGQNLILYGGLTATERFYGLKRIRDITTDLDFVCSVPIFEMLARRESLCYHEIYDVLYTVNDNVPVSFTYDHIHDWNIDDGFRSSSETINTPGFDVRCSSREYAIMLKMRRMNERKVCQAQPFGKDALDIINIVAAAKLGRERTLIDLKRLRTLLQMYITGDVERMRDLFAFIEGYKIHLNEREAVSFDEAFLELRRHVA